jgi:DNA polymerase-3 subunit delta
MVIFIYGEDTYRLRRKLAEIIGHYKKTNKTGLNLIYPDFSKEGPSSVLKDLEDSINQISMFKEKKMAVLINPFSNAAFKEEFLEEGDRFVKSDDIILFCQEGKIDERNALFKFLKKSAKCQEFQLFSGLKLKNWIKKEFEKYGKKVSPDIIDILVEFVGNDLWAMDNEIKKLTSFKKNGAITKEDVKKLVRPRIETDIFETIDAIAAKNKKRALELLNGHLEKGDSPLYLLAMICYQFRNLLIIKDLTEKRVAFYDITRKSGLHPFVVKKSYGLAQKFAFLELKKIYQKIFQVDLDIKTGKIQPEAALEMLIAEI